MDYEYTARFQRLGLKVAFYRKLKGLTQAQLAELLETSLPEEVEEEIITTALSVEGVDDIHELKTRRNGISFIIDAHVVVNPSMSVVEAHDIATNVEKSLRAKYGSNTQISIHIEPGVGAE